MGRLQRKKTTKKKKMRTAAAEGVGSAPAQTATAAPQAGAQASKPRSAVSKPISPLRGKAGGSKAIAVKREPNFVGKGIQFLREVRVELKKVTWPSRKQTIGSTVVVIILVMIISFFLGAVDIGLSSILRAVL